MSEHEIGCNCGPCMDREFDDFWQAMSEEEEGKA